MDLSSFLPSLSVKFYSNSKKPASGHLSCIYSIVKSQYTYIVFSELLTCTAKEKNFVS